MTAPDRRGNATGYPYAQAAQGGSSVDGAGRIRGYGMGQGQAPAAGPSPHLVPGQAMYAYDPRIGYVVPATSIPQQPPKKKRRVGFWIAIVVLLLAVAAACFIALTMCDGGTSKRQGSLGQLEGKTAEEIQAEIDRVVDEGMFNISIASVVEMESGTAPAELRIENVPGNRYLMKVVITRDDTGEQLYETDLIEPNHHIQRDTLDVDLPAGSYDCTATFAAYEAETEELAGQAAAKILLQVMS